MTKYFAIGLITGVIAGVVLGMLFAPDKGSETRKQITRAGEDLKEGLKNKLHNFGVFINEKLDDTRVVYNQFITLGKAGT